MIRHGYSILEMVNDRSYCYELGLYTHPVRAVLSPEQSNQPIKITPVSINEVAIFKKRCHWKTRKEEVQERKRSV
jgi:hypothetical protein